MNAESKPNPKHWRRSPKFPAATRAAPSACSKSRSRCCPKRLESWTRAPWNARGEARTLLYDKSGEEHYNVTSALIKSLRGSDPDAALYWLFRMLDAGDDPLFLLRRLMIFASEDVGNADPRSGGGRERGQRVSPHGPARGHVSAIPCLPVPGELPQVERGQTRNRRRPRRDRRSRRPAGSEKLRNAVTRLMKDEGYGQGYQYPPDREGSFVPGETYLPDEIAGRAFLRAPRSKAWRRRSASACAGYAASPRQTRPRRPTSPRHTSPRHPTAPGKPEERE